MASSRQKQQAVAHANSATCVAFPDALGFECSSGAVANKAVSSHKVEMLGSSDEDNDDSDDIWAVCCVIYIHIYTHEFPRIHIYVGIIASGTCGARTSAREQECAHTQRLGVAVHRG